MTDSFSPADDAERQLSAQSNTKAREDAKLRSRQLQEIQDFATRMNRGGIEPLTLVQVSVKIKTKESWWDNRLYSWTDATALAWHKGWLVNTVRNGDSDFPGSQTVTSMFVLTDGTVLSGEGANLSDRAGTVDKRTRYINHPGVDPKGHVWLRTATREDPNGTRTFGDLTDTLTKILRENRLLG